MKHQNRLVQGLVAGLLLAGTVLSGTAFATVVTYYGQDPYPSSSTTNSDTAHTNFMNDLASNVGTEDFESFSSGANAPITLTFPGTLSTLTANLQGNGGVRSGNNAGSHAHSGSNYYLAITGNSGNEFSIDFSSTPISAFGFYGSDISDSGSLFYVKLTATDGSEQTIQVTNNSNLRSGNQMFWGFTDGSNSYSKISFLSTSYGDYFGFDDMTIGDLHQVTHGVPEPAELGLFGLGLGLIGLMVARRRRRETMSH